MSDYRIGKYSWSPLADNSFDFWAGTSDPNGTIVAARGSVFHNTATGELYQKTTQGGSNGWKIVGEQPQAQVGVLGLVEQSPASPDTAQPSVAEPTKAEFDALLDELRDLKAKMRIAGLLEV